MLSFAGPRDQLLSVHRPRRPDDQDAAAPDASLGFLLVGALILVPIILAYTGFAYWVFRGKVDPNEGYH